MACPGDEDGGGDGGDGEEAREGVPEGVADESWASDSVADAFVAAAVVVVVVVVVLLRHGGLRGRPESGQQTPT